MKKILSIDGGGVRGLIPALALAEIEQQTQQPISDLFDLIVGTSTGGILALMLNIKDERGKAKYSAQSLTKIYLKQSNEVFDKSLLRSLPVVGNLVNLIADEIYSHQGLEMLLNNYLANKTMGETIKDVMITTYDMNNRTSIFIKSWKQEHQKLLMKDCARATSAAPSYFEPKQITFTDHNKSEIKNLIDGGIFINNPAMSAFVEMKKQQKAQNNQEDILLVSLGTGEFNQPYPVEEVKDWGKISWLEPMMDCMFDGMNDSVDYQLTQLLSDNYYRFQAELKTANNSLDDTSEDNLTNLKIDAQQIIDAINASNMLEKLQTQTPKPFNLIRYYQSIKKRLL